MCGRYAAAKDTDRLVEQFAIEEVVESAPRANFNVAPTAMVPMVIRSADDGRRQLRQARWGLLPPWSKDLKVGSRMINARWESLSDKPAFRMPFSRRRAILPADGYFEWLRTSATGAKPVKQPYYIHSARGESLAMAGLFEFWRPTPDAIAVVSATVITTAATGPLAQLHDRMPLLLPTSLFQQWLDRNAPFDPGLLCEPTNKTIRLAAHPVGLAVNSVANNGPQLIDPVVIATDLVLSGLDAAEPGL